MALSWVTVQWLSSAKKCHLAQGHQPFSNNGQRGGMKTQPFWPEMEQLSAALQGICPVHNVHADTLSTLTHLPNPMCHDQLSYQGEKGYY